MDNSLKNVMQKSNKGTMTQETPYSCPNATKYKNHLPDHIRTHSGKRPFKCPHSLYQKSFSSSSTLKSHKVVHTKVMKFGCSECKKKFTTKSDLNKHKRVHSEEKPFACPQCSFTTKHNENLRSHMTRIHSDDRPFKCGECHYAAKTKRDLNVHLKVHLGGKEKEKIKKHKCPHCPYKSHLSSYMKLHLMTHSGVKLFPCPHCPHESTRSSSLKVHIAHRHTGEKKFKCEYCDYSSVTSGQLNVHMRTHTGEKPYKCSFEGCKYSSTLSSTLRDHETIHRGKKPFKCLHCNYSAIQNSNLRKHLKIHKKKSKSIDKRKRVYGCKVRDCPFKTSDDKNLALHLNRAHKLPLISIKRIDPQNQVKGNEFPKGKREETLMEGSKVPFVLIQRLHLQFKVNGK